MFSNASNALIRTTGSSSRPLVIEKTGKNGALSGAYLHARLQEFFNQDLSNIDSTIDTDDVACISQQFPDLIFLFLISL